VRETLGPHLTQQANAGRSGSVPAGSGLTGAGLAVGSHRGGQRPCNSRSGLEHEIPGGRFETPRVWEHCVLFITPLQPMPTRMVLHVYNG
jgi:hypothetical protein